ncbi:DUF2637 domain-containing protein [Streptomyces sp. NPDC086766]|uniref:DUF2637 domain-containing protein n=1 Tax=Streptomyces sp. NPDC086766 TaxID=3365754 RepID=UPI0037FF177C
MYDERIDGHPGRSADYPDYLDGYQQTGTGRHRAPTPPPTPDPAPEAYFSTPLVPPDSAWDPAEELAFMLQDAMLEQNRPRIPTARTEMPDPVTPTGSGTPLENLQEITAELPPLRRVSRGHRKVRKRKWPPGLRAVSQFIAALAAVTASAVSLFGGMVAYDPLRIVAVSRMQAGIASWWPLLVFGPWLVASLSVLRAALHRRRAVHSWCAVLLFSAIAMFLCVVQAPRTLVDVAAAALPGLASLTCFQQLVRQITLTRPPRRVAPRHRQRRAPQSELPADGPTSAPASGRTAPAAGRTRPATARTSPARGKAGPAAGRSQPSNGKARGPGTRW